MNEIEPEAAVELEAQEVRWRARAVGGIIELAGILPDPGDKLVEALCRHAGVGDQHQRRLDTANERDEIIELPSWVAERAGIDLARRLGHHQNEIAVGRRTGHELCADVP